MGPVDARWGVLAAMATLSGGLLVGCGIGTHASVIPTSTSVFLTASESIEAIAVVVEEWVGAETVWMRAVIDDRIGYEEFDELSWRTEGTLDLMLEEVIETVDAMPADTRATLKPVVRHLTERADAFGTMVLLFFEGTEAGREASMRTYLQIIHPDHVGAVVDTARTEGAATGLDAQTEAAFEGLLKTLKQG
jgi:hypothetical protein